MVRARLWDDLTACQTQGLLSQLASVPVLVEVEVPIFYLTPPRLPLAVHQHIQVTCKQSQLIKHIFHLVHINLCDSLGMSKG